MEPHVTVVVLVSALARRLEGSGQRREDALVAQAAIVVGGAFFAVPFFFSFTFRIRQPGFT